MERGGAGAVHPARPGADRGFRGLDLIEPGIVSCPEWRPDPDEAGVRKMDELCALGRK